MALILRPGRDTHKHKNDNIRNKVRQRMHRIRHHGGAVPCHPGQRLQPHQQQIHNATRQGNPCYFIFTFLHMQKKCSAAALKI